MKQGDVQVLMVKGANPMYGLPNASGFRDASYDVPFIFSFSGFMDDTTAMADLILPEHNYLEDWGSDVPTAGPGYEMIGFQQPVVRPFFEGRGEHLGTRNFADILMTIAQGLELDLELGADTFRDILREGAQQLFDLNRGSVQASGFAEFWHGVLQRGGWWGRERKGAARAGGNCPRFPRPRSRSSTRTTDSSSTSSRSPRLRWARVPARTCPGCRLRPTRSPRPPGRRGWR